MKKAGLKHAVLILLGCILLLGGCVAAYADGVTREINYQKVMSVSSMEMENCHYFVDLSKKYPKCKVLSVKSDNTKAVKPYDRSGSAFSFNAPKAGTAKLKVKIKLANGRKKTLKPTVKVYKPAFPFKSVKADGKKLKIYKFDVQSNASFTTAKKKVKVVLKLKKGWKIKSVTAYVYDWDTGTEKIVKGNLSALKQLDSEGTNYKIVAQNKKTKVQEEMVFELYQK